ncbi:MAG: hypothetical protein HQL12_05755 [Candidatus Omnitrophica bacterium]|nr:hypothetical protein [Candidatus Omnitrophota bacterium]
MSADLPKVGPKSSDPLYLIKPLTAGEEIKMQKSLREIDKTLGIPNERTKSRKVHKNIDNTKEMTHEDEESNENEDEELEEPNENKSVSSKKKKEPDSGKRWVNIKFLVKHTGYAEPTLREFVRLGKIPVHKREGSRLLRFDLAEIDEWMDGKNKAVDK